MRKSAVLLVVFALLALSVVALAGADTIAPSVATGPTSKAACMKGGWKTFTSPKFKNQGQCIKAANKAAHAAAGKSNNGKSDSNSKGNGNDD